MNLLDQICLVEAKKKAPAKLPKGLRDAAKLGMNLSIRSQDKSSQRRGPSPGKEGGSDTTRSNQPVACPHSTAGSVRRVVQGSPPPGTMPQSGEGFESDVQGQAAADWYAGKTRTSGARKRVNDSFEATLMSAIFSDEEMLLEFTSKNWGRRGHVKKMSTRNKM